MSTIDVSYGNASNAQQRTVAAQTARTDAQASAQSGRNGDVEARLRQDTVSLSDGAEKIVNLNRGAALEAEIKSAAVDETFADKLRRAVEDVFRVNDIFRSTVRGLFGWWKK